MQNSVITTIKKKKLKKKKKIQQVLRLWNSLTLSLEGRTMIFETTAILKIAYLALIANVPKLIVKELQKMQKKFLCQNSPPKIKHKILSNAFETGGLKNVDISLKVISLQCSRVKNCMMKIFMNGK